jgi:hypothetical protein
VKKGAVTLFSIVNDTEKKVKLVIDQRLTEADYVAFHPMQNDATTSITAADMMKIVQLSLHEPEILDFSKLAAATPVEEKKEETKGAKGGKAKKEEGKIEDALKIGIEYTKEQNFSKWYQ